MCMCATGYGSSVTGQRSVRSAMVAPGVSGTARHVEHAFIRRERDENGGMDALF